MKSCGYIFVLLAIFVTCSTAATARGFYNDPKNPGKCTINADLILSPGDSIKDPNANCGRITCGQNGMAVFDGCGVQSVQDCRMGDFINLALPYPECCKREIICD